MSGHDHADYAGERCSEDASGCCRECGVALVTCEDCGGRGYHVPGAPCEDDGVTSRTVAP